MKLLMLAIFLSSTTVFAISEKNNLQKEAVGKNSIESKTGIKVLDEKEEDCDEKAKKPIEITPESISLSGNAGCSLDEAQP